MSITYMTHYVPYCTLQDQLQHNTSHSRLSVYAHAMDANCTCLTIVIYAQNVEYEYYLQTLQIFGTRTLLPITTLILQFT